MTERDEAIAAFVRAYWAERGYSPSLREIGAAVGMRSTSMVRYRLDKLEAAGVIERTPGISRSIRLRASLT